MYVRSYGHLANPFNMNQKSLAYQKKVLNPWVLRFGMWRRLPSVAFWGMRITELTEERCSVLIPFTWFTQNPFKSIYFGALSGGAELSTGALCEMMIIGKGNFSMLVTGFRAEFIKKATTNVTFTCNQGKQLSDVLDQMTQAGDTSTLVMEATGHNILGELIGKAYIQWSFKRKS